MSERSQENMEDELSLAEIVEFFKNGWKGVVLSGLVGGALGTGYAFWTPEKYLATARIQVARVANIDVEPASWLVEKLRMPTYLSTNSTQICGLEHFPEPRLALAKALNPSQAQGSPIISVSFRAASPDAAKRCLESVLADIRTNQNEIARPMLEAKMNHLANLKQKLESSEKLLKVLSPQKYPFDFSDSRFSANALLLSTILSKETKVKDLRTQIADLEIALAEPQTRETYLTTDIYAPNVRVEPKRSLIILLSALCGVVSSLAYFLIRKACFNNQDKRKD